MKKRSMAFRMIMSAILSGIVMWVIGGLYHNLIMPAINENMHPHHEGLGITLVAYIILGLFISIFYQNSKEIKNSLAKGLKIGILIGILWVFPHGLTMAAVHESSILYELKNTIYHLVEQGIGGMMVFVTYRFLVDKK